MITVFPNFKKLELNDRTEIETFLKAHPPYSDFNFVSLWSYNIKNDISLSRLYGNLVVKFRDYLTTEQFYSFLGNSNVLTTVKTLLHHAKDNNIAPVLKLIPEITINTDQKLKDHFAVTEDRENHDYILSLESMSALGGEKYHNIRNAVNNFAKNHKHAEFKMLDFKDEQTKREILTLCNTWKNQKNASDDDVEHEFTAIQRLLNDSHHLDIFSLGVYEDNTMIGFFIAEIMHDGFAIGHFMKADIAFKGIFESMYKRISQELLKRGCTHFNIEQDLGIDGIRKSKEQLNPSSYLKKYKIYELP